MGRETGSSSAAPIFRDFMREALKDKSKVPFRIPEGVTLSPVNRNTGEPSYIGAPDFILEAFRPGSEPTVGELKSTIRYGTGSDSFGNYDFGLGDDEDTADENSEEENLEDETSEKTAEASEGEAAEESDAKEATEAKDENKVLKDKVKDLLQEIEEAPETENTVPTGEDIPEVQIEPTA